jgi:two-component system, OmpR family, sensor kinase
MLGRIRKAALPAPIRPASLLRRTAARAKAARRAQLRTRVVAGVLAVTLTALAAFDFAAITGLRGYLLDHTDTQLQGVLSLYGPGSRVQVRRGSVREGPPVFIEGTRPTQTHSAAPRNATVIGPRFQVPALLDEYYVEYVSHSKLRGFFGGNPNLRPQLPADLHALAARHGAQTVTSANGRDQLRLMAEPLAGGTLVLTASLGPVDSTLDRLEIIVIVGSAIAGLLVALGVAWVARRGLRPIEAMAAEADKITAGDLTNRVGSQDSATEVGRLGAALNGMLGRIEASVRDREASQELARRFFADASHELRNPLASLRANAELYQQGALPDRPQVDEAMRRIALEARRMSALVDDMLRLARLDQHPEPQHDRVDLSVLLGECTERAQIASPQRTWRTRVAPGLEVTGDQELLRRAIDNLLANVRAHTPAGTTATITSTRGHDDITVHVADDGPGVPATKLPRIFDRFTLPAPAQL